MTIYGLPWWLLALSALLLFIVCVFTMGRAEVDDYIRRRFGGDREAFARWYRANRALRKGK